MLKIFKDQPRGLYLLSFLEVADRFTFYGIASILILYLIKNLNDSDPRAYLIFGIFTALSFIVPIAGGMMADKFLGYKRSVFLGLWVSFIALCILLLGANAQTLVDQGLLAGKSYFLYAGLAVLVCGIGLFKASNLTLVGTLYPKSGPLRDNGFLICYTAMNIGAILGSLSYGFITLVLGYKFALFTSLIVYFISIMAYWLFNNSIHSHTEASVREENDVRHQTKRAFVIPGLIIAFGVIGCLFIFPQIFNALLIVISIGVVALIVMAARNFPLFKKKIAVLVALIFFAVFYFILHMQTGGSLMLYVSRFVNTKVGESFIPPAALLSLQGIFVIVLSPLLASLWLKLNNEKPRSGVGRVLLGLCFGVLSFMLYTVSAYLPNDGLISPRFLGIILGYFLLALGDMCISPMITSAVSTLAPKERQGTFMGIWYFSNGLAAYMASIVAKHAIVPTSTDIYDFTHGFYLITAIGIVATLALLLLSPLLRRWEQ